MAKNCVFCGIVSGDLPARVVYQDDNVISFLSKDAESFGHTLIVPKEHFPDLYSIPEKLLGAILAVVKKISIHYKNILGASGVNLLHASGKSAQQSVFHFHIHLIPRFDDDNLDLWPHLEPKEWNKDEFLQKVKL